MRDYDGDTDFFRHIGLRRLFRHRHRRKGDYRLCQRTEYASAVQERDRRNSAGHQRLSPVSARDDGDDRGAYYVNKNDE